MAGLAGEAIGLGTANANPIGGTTRVTTDGGAVGRGSLENFIGFRLDGEITEQAPADLSAADDTVTVGATGNPQQEPVYSSSPTPDSTVLTWTDV